MNDPDFSFFTHPIINGTIQSDSLVLDTQVLDQVSESDVPNLYPSERAVVNWYRGQEEKGLQSVSFGVISCTASDQSNEALCAALLEIIRAPVIPDNELL